MFKRDPRYVIETPTRREAIWLCIGLLALSAAGITLVVLARMGVA